MHATSVPTGSVADRIKLKLTNSDYFSTFVLFMFCLVLRLLAECA